MLRRHAKLLFDLGLVVGDIAHRVDHRDMALIAHQLRQILITSSDNHFFLRQSARQRIRAQDVIGFYALHLD